MTHRENRIAKVERSRQLRRDPTPAEKALWERLRGGQLGARFRRQHVFRGFILDFYCASTKLAIEVDGSVHDCTSDYDSERSEILAFHGVRILRFTNESVLNDTRSVIASIAQDLAMSD